MTRASDRRRSTRSRQTPDTVAFLDGLYGSDPAWNRLVERARVNRDVAHAIYHLRTTRGLTQRQLADLVGTKQPVIARLEDADYDGHSLSMLSRIAAALGQRLEVRFVPAAGAGRGRRVAEGPREKTRLGLQVSEGSAKYGVASRAAGARKSAGNATSGRLDERSGRGARAARRRKPT